MSANSTKVVTGPVRLSYAHIFEAHATLEGQTPKFSTVILIPKTDTKTLDKIRAAQKVALEQGKNSKFGGKIPNNWKNTLRDGDLEKDTEENPEYAGHMFMSVSANNKPGVVDRDLNPILDQSEIYSGCYARVSINAFPFSAQGNKGVSFGLNNVQKWADGDYLGGRASAESDFGGLDDDEDLL